ncbi:xanthine dehydrogenase family protein [Herbaspirillum sp. AP02]|uniref:xanthine dehydrogenase family protein molybdopterin-binding subunit n=1 Tax=unclassified Herbaspirillum TaxID=2624150 RepID=UPI0015D9906A|nr:MULTISPECIES: xanthine dehydrogenase family protein molybdopterin-binding subunit [unclassified Herbaspirillum]MBG7619089.1 xanthine dehydrogenase family protein [Herbaspirillum sp. AP02]NZD66373.1 xanthine dehydrogenase family protein [Herbaspirillum sp. AP21]
MSAAAQTAAAGLIGRSVARADAERFVAGRGRYLDDLVLADMQHVVFYRSPFARARLHAINVDAAAAMPGVSAVVTGADLATVCAGWTTRFALWPAHVSAPQNPLAIDEVFWQGEAVAAVVAATRAQAEDALELIEIDWEEGEPVVDPSAALEPGCPPCHPAIEHNLALERKIGKGDVAAAFAGAAQVVRRRFSFGRQTGVPLEPRGILASFDRRTGELDIQQSHQAPFQMQEIYASLLGLPLERVRVASPDVGGAFGIKLHAYADEIAVVAIAMLLGRPVKFQADRLESFVSDVHARDASVEAQLAVDAEGHLLGLDVDLLFCFGAVSAYPRSSIGEALQALDLCGSAYRIDAFRGRVRGAFVNKVPTGAYRAVGQPIACAVIEQLIDDAAAAIGMDPVTMRRRNHLPARPAEAPMLPAAGGIPLGPLSLDACMDQLLENMDYRQLRATQDALRQRGVYRGIGLCTFVELTGVGAGLYGPNQVRVAGKEGVRLSLLPSGHIQCRTSATDQGQGTRTGLTQIVAQAMGSPLETVAVAAGDTSRDPLGGGAWASRGISLAGEAALLAAAQLRANILSIAAALGEQSQDGLDIVDGMIIGRDGETLMSLAEVALKAHYDSTAIKLDVIPELTVERSYAPTGKPYFAANGVQAAQVEVDVETGMIRVLDVWVVEDCGRIVNPLLTDEQIRGGVVQGIGAALFEQCIYSENGQMSNASLADYLIPMASEMPQIHVGHVTTPERETSLGAKGVGEAGTVGAIGAIWCAVNDALRPLGQGVWQQPFTPAHVLDVLHHPEMRQGEARLPPF